MTDWFGRLRPRHIFSELDLLKKDHASLTVMFNERSDTIGCLTAEVTRLRAALLSYAGILDPQSWDENCQMRRDANEQPHTDEELWADALKANKFD